MIKSILVIWDYFAITLQVYIKGSIEAVELYQKAFDATLGYHVLNTDNTYMHTEINLADVPYTLSKAFWNQGYSLVMNRWEGHE